MAASKADSSAPSAPPAAAPAAPVDTKSALVTPFKKGNKRMYYVGLIEEAPFDSIDVPTVAFPHPSGKSFIRGKCVNVPKFTGKLTSDGKGNFIHIGNARIGRVEELYDIEYEAFINYCNTHVFRMTGKYSYPVAPENPNQPGPVEYKEAWRAEIDQLDPTLSSMRTLHDEDSIRDELISKYVWIHPVPKDSTDSGRKPTIFEVETEKKAEKA